MDLDGLSSSSGQQRRLEPAAVSEVTLVTGNAMLTWLPSLNIFQSGFLLGRKIGTGVLSPEFKDSTVQKDGLLHFRCFSRNGYSVSNTAVASLWSSSAIRIICKKLKMSGIKEQTVSHLYKPGGPLGDERNQTKDLNKFAMASTYINQWFQIGSWSSGRRRYQERAYDPSSGWRSL